MAAREHTTALSAATVQSILERVRRLSFGEERTPLNLKKTAKSDPLRLSVCLAKS